MSATILLIDDDDSLLELLERYLSGAGYTVLAAPSGPEGLRLLYSKRPDLVVLDVMMPSMDGWEVCERIRELTDVPLIFLTVRATEADRLCCFRKGADDFLAKPFSFAELGARIEAILRRAAKEPTESDDVLVCGPFRLDRTRREVTRGGEPIELTPTEYRLLEIFMKRPDRVFTKEELVRDVWGPEYVDDTGYIRRYVWRLRRQIEPDQDARQYLVTERGFGYRFRVE